MIAPSSPEIGFQNLRGLTWGKGAISPPGALVSRPIKEYADGFFWGNTPPASQRSAAGALRYSFCQLVQSLPIIHFNNPISNDYGATTNDGHLSPRPKPICQNSRSCLNSMEQNKNDRHLKRCSTSHEWSCGCTRDPARRLHAWRHVRLDQKPISKFNGLPSRSGYGHSGDYSRRLVYPRIQAIPQALHAFACGVRPILSKRLHDSFASLAQSSLPGTKT